MTFHGPQSCSLPACKGSKLPKFQTPSPTCTLGPRPLPQQAPQGQATAMAFYGLSKLAFLGFQSCRLPARKPSKTLQTLQTPSPTCTLGPRQLPQQAPQGQATAMAFYGLSKLPFASPQRLQSPPKFQTPRARATAMRLFMGFQSSRLPARKGSKLSKTKFQTPSPTGTPGPRPLPQQAPQGQGQGHFPNRHPRARPQQCFLWAFKAAVCQPANPPIPSKIPNPQGQGHSNETFYGLSKLPFASPQTLQNSPNAPNPPKPAKPSKHRP